MHRVPVEAVMKPVNQQGVMCFDQPAQQKVEDFGGSTYSPSADGVRLTGHLGRVYDLMKDGVWRTITQIAELTSGSEPGTSARLRDLRKPQHGGHTVERRRSQFQNSVYEYRMIG